MDYPPWYAKFTVNTTQHHFVKASRPSRTLQTVEGTYTVSDWGPMGEDGLYWATVNEVGTLGPGEQALEMSILEIAPERIYVEWWCEHDVLLKSYYFQGLLERVIDMYPEAGPILWEDEEEANGNPSGAKVGRGGKSGKPRFPENKWAREQVNELGRPQKEVYKEWLEKKSNRGSTLADPWDSFKKAIKVKRGGGKKGKKGE